MIEEYEYIKTEVNGEIIIIPIRKQIESTFFTFNELQGIRGNNGYRRCSKKESCYVPAKELLKKGQSGPVLTKKLTPPRNQLNK